MGSSVCLHTQSHLMAKVITAKNKCTSVKEMKGCKEKRKCGIAGTEWTLAVLY